MTTEKSLQTFEDKMLKQVSPLEQKSLELLEKATDQEVFDDVTLAQAVAVKKEINAHSKLVKDSRLALTRPLDEMKKLIMSKESEVMLPLDKAKANVADKILTYEEELERLRQIEIDRVNQILEIISVSAWSLKTAVEVDYRGKEIKDAFAKLSEADQNNADIKLAFRTSIDSLTTRKTNLEEEERQRVERERLAKEAEKQSVERAALDKERAAIEAKERELQADRERQQRELERQELEAKATEQRKTEAAAEKARPKSNIATVTEFEIETPSIVDRIYCSPDSVKIRQAIKDGTTKIAGVRIFQTKKVR